MAIDNEQRQQWEDDVMKGAEFVKKFMTFMLKERSQLYGVIEYLMKDMDITEVYLPPMEEFKEIGNKYYVLFEDDENGNFRVVLKEQTQGE